MTQASSLSSAGVFQARVYQTNKSLVRSLQFSTVLSLTLILLIIPFDTSVSGWISELAPKGSILRWFVKLPDYFFRWQGFVLVGFCLAWMLYHNRINSRAVRGQALAVVICLTLLHLLKFTIGRARPELGLGSYYLSPINVSASGFDSFPSGHSTSAILIAALLCWQFPRYKWLIIPPAVLACVARIVLQRHFVSDCVAGVCLALAVVWTTRLILGRRAFPSFQL